MTIDGMAEDGATTPARGRRKKEEKTLTTAQRLGSLVKSARDIMRKDKGLNGDLDRLPMLTWVMFLKFVDDLEQEREMFAESDYKPIIEEPYRWRDWATNNNKLTGDDLLAFISNERAVLPDGSEGLGLFPYLRTLAGSDVPQRNVVGTIFRALQNRMMDGYLLRTVVNLVDGIHFDSSEEIHTLGNMYETMLKEMRDAAGDSGEFYTPKPVVQFIVRATNPRLGEVVFDPACGTGGFLVEAYSHLKEQAQTVEDRRVLQERSIVGGEAKGLPYLLAQMNLLLHGVEQPRVTLDNSLKVNLTDIGDRERVDVILTNPPFGGEEEPSIQNNFPVGFRTSETALLFLQLIMRKLRRQPKPGRAGVVVPNGTLFADGVAAKIKEQLLKEFNLHTVVRLPNGVFAPYTSIPTNILFFDRTGPTSDIWYYEHRLPEGKKNYTKTAPLQVEELQPILDWWDKREENVQAWKVSAADILKYGETGGLLSVNLDVKNPNAAEDITHLPPEQLVEDIITKERRILELMEEIREALGAGGVK
jgi:type I restriction enzyme M protein